MSHEDKLIGMRDDNRVYASHRVDFNSDKDPRNDLELSYAVKVPPQGYTGHEAKEGYKRKAVCETASAKNKVVDWCKNNNVSYTVEEINLTQEEKDAFESYRAENGLQAKEACKWLNALQDLDKGNISRKDFELGKNPHRGEKFKTPNQGRASN